MKTACKRMITQQVSEILRIEIEDGDLYPGTKIPTDTELAEMFGVQKQIVRTAIEVLVKEGLLKYISDKEVYVLGHKIERNMEKLEGFTQTMVDRNMKPSFRIVSKYLRMAGNLYGNMFGIKPEEPIFYIKRMCYADGDSISLEELYIPYYLIPKMEGIDLSVFSVYEVYEMYGIHLAEAEQTFQIKGKIKIMGLFTGNFYSKNLRMTTQINVIFPDVSNDVTPLYEGTPKVLYLLHGLSGNSDEWTRFSKIEYYAKKYNFIIIMPEVQRSFYTTGKVGIDYFHYVADELPAICGKWFHLDQRRENTFIAGESMGGYGAVKIALNRPEKYEAVASLSGVLDYVGFTEMVLAGNWEDMSPQEIQSFHGEAGKPEEWENPLFLVEKLAKDENRPRLIQFCGTEDFLYENNQKFRKVAESNGYGHVYMEGPGDHEWPYWDKMIQRAIQFFLNLDLQTTKLY